MTKSQIPTGMKPLPVIMGRPIKRCEVIEALWEGYKALVAMEKLKDATTTGFPDMVTVLKHIEEHGLPPKDE